MVQYHPGELAAQRRAGVAEQAEYSRLAIGTTLPPPAMRFLTEQPMIVIGGADDDGRMWASLLTGPPGFISAPDERTIDVDTRPVPGDPLAPVLARPAQVGTIAIEAGTRRRMRLNGVSHPRPGGLRVTAEQVYANCPKYIQQRTPHRVAEARPAAPPVVGATLTPTQQQTVRRADTFFVATRSAAGACDASHRGGNPGFVRVLSPARLRWPDYIGNAMLMTLGNLQQDPAAGLLLVDWSTGTTLHLTGTAEVDWEPAVAMPGAQRAVDFHLERVVQIDHASPLVWSAPTYSRFNPTLDPETDQP
ncbi:pyridoxamine 5'-phosphate oxidase family protein [Micromonospora sp. NPDC047670]|uniref:pyridoxamine 5'-phosphate oxidase family protein n=1 Tax=Micromonospora sp. NPDC047670 TaxID=3364252 RepID=UPI00372265B2